MSVDLGAEIEERLKQIPPGSSTAEHGDGSVNIRCPDITGGQK